MSRAARPITDRDLREIEILSGFGLTEAAVARVLGFSARQFRRRKRADRVLAALEKGRALAQAKVADALFKRAIRGDITAIIWWEKTRAGRTDRQVIEQSGKDGAPLEVHVIYDDLPMPDAREPDELTARRLPRAPTAPNGNGGSH